MTLVVSKAGFTFPDAQEIWYTICMEENTIFQMNSDLTYGRGYVYCLQFHMVFVTKYRKHIFVGEIETQVNQFIIATLRKLDIELIAMETMPSFLRR